MVPELNVQPLFLYIHVSMDHKTSHMGQFYEIEIYTSHLYMQNNQNTEKITFKVVQMKFLTIHFTNQKISFDIFTVGNVQTIFKEYDLYLMS